MPAPPLVFPKAAMVAMLAGASLTACATLPPAGPPRVAKPAEAYAAAIALTAPAADWPADRWWTAYGDPQMTALIDEALAGSPDLASAQARLVRAQALASRTQASALPQVTANASVQSVRQSYNNGIPAVFVPKGFNDTGRLSLDFAYELDFFGKNRAALAAATSDAEAARADVAAARLLLATNVAAAYGDLSSAYADRDTADALLKGRLYVADLVGQRVINGMENTGADDQAAASVASSRAALAAADETIALTRNRIAVLVGAGPDRGLAITRPQIGALRAFGLPANLQVDLIGRRPDVVAARARVEAANQTIRQAKAEFYPNVNLAAYFGQQALGLDVLRQSGSFIGGIGPALSLPIFDAGRLRAGYRAASADYDAATASYDGAVGQALREVADAAVSTRALDIRLSESRKARNGAKAAFDIALQRYQGGLAGFIEVLTADESLIANQREVSNLEARAFTLDVALIRALGGGFHAS